MVVTAQVVTTVRKCTWDRAESLATHASQIARHRQWQGDNRGTMPPYLGNRLSQLFEGELKHRNCAIGTACKKCASILSPGNVYWPLLEEFTNNTNRP